MEIKKLLRPQSSTANQQTMMDLQYIKCSWGRQVECCVQCYLSNLFMGISPNCYCCQPFCFASSNWQRAAMQLSHIFDKKVHVWFWVEAEKIESEIRELESERLPCQVRSLIPVKWCLTGVQLSVASNISSSKKKELVSLHCCLSLLPAAGAFCLECYLKSIWCFFGDTRLICMHLCTFKCSATAFVSSQMFYHLHFTAYHVDLRWGFFFSRTSLSMRLCWAP